MQTALFYLLWAVGELWVCCVCIYDGQVYSSASIIGRLYVGSLWGCNIVVTPY